jgi:Transposase domain (DUF772)
VHYVFDRTPIARYGRHHLRSFPEHCNWHRLAADHGSLSAAIIAMVPPRPNRVPPRQTAHAIAPERLLRALLLQAFYTIRLERQLMEQLHYNFLYRWFVGPKSIAFFGVLQAKQPQARGRLRDGVVPRIGDSDNQCRLAVLKLISLRDAGAPFSRQAGISSAAA